MLPRRTRSAIRAVLDVARLARGRPLPAKMLGRDDGLAPRQFESVLQDLVRAGVLRSVRGPLGGYLLARERRRITLGDVARALDGGPAAGVPLDAEPPGLTAALAEAEAAYRAVLDRVTVEDLCQRPAPRPSASQDDPDFAI